MNHEELFRVVDSLSDRYLAILEEVCNIESPTSHKSGVDAVGAYLIKQAEALGCTVEIHEEPVSGNCICLTMNPTAIDAPIALSGHMDTVHAVGSFGSPAVRIEGDRIYGPGTCDCKGGIVAALMAMEALSICGYQKRPILLLLQSDEEVSSITSQKRTVNYMAEKAKDAIAFLNCEGYAPPGITVSRKGIIRYQLDIQGIAAHSSKCYEAGASAIREAAHKILALEKWKDGDGITCNCGVIEGGSVPNTVPEHCSFLVDIRYRTKEELLTVQQRVKEIAEHSYVEGTTCTLSVKSQRVAMEATEANLSLFRTINEIFEQCGLPKHKMGHAHGGSDAADISSHGIPTVDSVGIQGARIHSLDEYAYISSLAESAKRLAAIVWNI